MFFPQLMVFSGHYYLIVVVLIRFPTVQQSFLNNFLQFTNLMYVFALFTCLIKKSYTFSHSMARWRRVAGCITHMFMLLVNLKSYVPTISLFSSNTGIFSNRVYYIHIDGVVEKKSISCRKTTKSKLGACIGELFK